MEGSTKKKKKTGDKGDDDGTEQSQSGIVTVNGIGLTS